MTPLNWIRRFLYFPETVVPPIEAVLPGGEVVRYQTDDGMRLLGWFLPVHGPIATVIVFHGNGGTMADRSDLARGLADRGMAVLLAEYRGYGGNPGEPSEDGLLADAAAALTYLRGRPDVDPDRIVYFGESLGSGVSVGLSADHPPAVLVLRSPFTSFAEVIAMHYPMLPAAPLLPDQFDSLERIPAVTCPLLVIAGSADSIVPASLSCDLYEAAAGEKRYVEYPGADHNDWEISAGEAMLDDVAAFVGEHIGR